jgi:hypothetical protein
MSPVRRSASASSHPPALTAATTTPVVASKRGSHRCEQPASWGIQYGREARRGVQSRGTRRTRRRWLRPQRRRSICSSRARRGGDENRQRWRPDVLSRSITGLVLQPIYRRSGRTAQSDSEPCAAGSGFVGLECSRRRDPRGWWGPPRCVVGGGVRKPQPQRSPRTPQQCPSHERQGVSIRAKNRSRLIYRNIVKIGNIGSKFDLNSNFKFDEDWF